MGTHDFDELLSNILGSGAAGGVQDVFGYSFGKKVTKGPGMRLRTFYLPEPFDRSINTTALLGLKKELFHHPH